MRKRSLVALGSFSVASLLIASLLVERPAAAATTPRVLRVGSFHGVAGQFRRIQAAVDAAHPGDWILIGPGDYRERGSLDPEDPAGVLIETDGLHVR
ncbi:MAG: hypothetical protein ABR600_07265, partial [Actinomycetota bacterium]